MRLHYHPISGHAHRARLGLSLLDFEHELVEVDLAARAHKAPEFLKLNAFGQVPVLDDAGTIVPDSNAILVYLALKRGDGNWLPCAPEAVARVQRWLSVAAGDIAFGPAAARLITIFGAPFSADEVVTRAHRVLTVMEAELDERAWIAADRPTIADIALYSYDARAPEGKVDLPP